MELEKTVELNLLLDTYGALLTPRMQEILTMYVCENLSMQEIGNYFNISKPAVLDAINASQKKLQNYESKIKMLSLKSSLIELVKGNNLNVENLQKLLQKY